MEEFLREIGINNELIKTDDGNYKIDIPDSNEFAKIYSKLDKSLLVDEDEESSQVTVDTISIQYLGDKYTITLLGDLDADTYSLTIK